MRFSTKPLRSFVLVITLDRPSDRRLLCYLSTTASTSCGFGVIEFGLLKFTYCDRLRFGSLSRCVKDFM